MKSTLRRLCQAAAITGAAFTLLAASASAAPIPCPESGALSALIGMTAEGCISQDKIFSNFAYTVPTGGVSAGDVNFNLVLQTGLSDIHGWSFVPQKAWVLGFVLSYDVTVAPGFPNAFIYQSKDQINTGAVPNGIVISDLQTGVSPSPLVVTGTAGGETVFSNTYNLQTIHTVSTAVIPVGRNLLTYEQDWFESSVPEPASLSLIGGGLFGLGMLLRRRRKNA